MPSRLRRLVLVGAVAVAGLALPGVAQAAPWCGSGAAADRPFIASGYTVRVLYALPSDAADRSAELAPRIWADVEEIDAWWRANDPTRTPNFDLTNYDCGPQLDLTVRRFTLGSAELAVAATRFARIRDNLFLPRDLDTIFTKYLVYFDGPVEDARLCGEGGGGASGTGLALVYLQACPGGRTAPVAIHELIHAMGALFRITAPHACPGDLGHVCDSPTDILYPVAAVASLSSFVLDSGRDDYYGHGHPWFDLQDSNWLRHLDASTPLALTVRGRGTVRSDVPGLLCSASCQTSWNPGTAVILVAQPAAGQRFVRWGGECIGETVRCDLLLDHATAATAVFAPSRYRLSIQVAGRGRVAGGGLSCSAGSCARAMTSYRTVTLRATPRPGWRLRAWTGACRGARTTCVVPMNGATSVRATFVRRS